MNSNLLGFFKTFFHWFSGFAPVASLIILRRLFECLTNFLGSRNSNMASAFRSSSRVDKEIKMLEENRWNSQLLNQSVQTELNYGPILVFFPDFFSKKARNQPFKNFLVVRQLWLSKHNMQQERATSKRKSLKQPHFFN